MGYKLFDKEGNETSHHNLQDKSVWCKMGMTKEEAFVQLYGEKLGVIINPEKAKNKYAPDLLNVNNGILGDLKTQNTPFFQGKSRFGINPQYAVVFNGKDRDRYKSLYPEIEIYFAVDWQIIKFQNENSVIEVHPMIGVWFISFTKLDVLLETAPYHEYRQRYDDNKGNAKGSYVLNLSNDSFSKLV